MSVRRSELGRDAMTADAGACGGTVRAGLLGGLVGGVSIWIYEAIVWVGVQRLMPLAGIPRNATGLVFGKEVQERWGPSPTFSGREFTSFSASPGACSLLSYGPISGAAATRPRSWPCSMP